MIKNLRISHYEKKAIQVQTVFFNATDSSDYTDYLLGQTKNPINLVNL